MRYLIILALCYTMAACATQQPAPQTPSVGSRSGLGTLRIVITQPDRTQTVTESKPFVPVK